MQLGTDEKSDDVVAVIRLRERLKRFIRKHLRTRDVSAEAEALLVEGTPVQDETKVQVETNVLEETDPFANIISNPEIRAQIYKLIANRNEEGSWRLGLPAYIENLLKQPDFADTPQPWVADWRRNQEDDCAGNLLNHEEQI